jgi:hypothetical protein|tara:strand:+ start:628 stop:1293 length:666 start_codon:yes stop_codon:yes gene_type:complete
MSPALAPFAGAPFARARRPAPTRRASRARARESDDARASLSSLDAILSTDADRASSSDGASARDDAPSDAATPTRAVSRAVDVALDDDVVARVELEVRSATSRLTRATMKSPLGIVFEDVDGDIAVVEFYDESDLGPRGRGIREGDVLRATSAMIPEMRYPKLNVIGGGVGRPGWRRVMYTCASSQDGNLDDVTFDQAMKAIGSNAKAGNYDVELVFERRA